MNTKTRFVVTANEKFFIREAMLHKPEFKSETVMYRIIEDFDNQYRMIIEIPNGDPEEKRVINFYLKNSRMDIVNQDQKDLGPIAGEYSLTHKGEVYTIRVLVGPNQEEGGNHVY